MSNELYNSIARVTDGIYEGIVCSASFFPSHIYIYIYIKKKYQNLFYAAT